MANSDAPQDEERERTVEKATVPSGDLVILDAASAISDATDTDTRSLTLMAGAGYFGVDTSKQSFVVRHAGKVVEVQAGKRIRWSQTTTLQPEPVVEAAIASWRNDVPVTDGMTTGEVAAIIDRRVPNSVVALTDALKRTIVFGRLDLSRPTDALRSLAATVDAGVTTAPPLGVLIRP